MTTSISRRQLLRSAPIAGTALALPALGLPGTALAQPTPPTPPGSDVLPASAALIRNLVRRGQIAGGLAALGHEGTFSTVASGALTRGGARRPDADTLWRLYSQTKPVTGMAAMQLIESGRLSLDQPVAEILPEWADARVQLNPNTLDSRPAVRPMTIRHLLTHTAGLGYTIVTQGPLLGEYIRLGLNPAAVGRVPLPGVPNVPTAPSLDEFSRRLATLPLIADPGARWSYSVAADLLGRVVEVAGGLPFDRYLQERMFAPLRMDDTAFQVPASKVDRLSSSYAGVGGLLIPVDPAANSVFTDPPAFPFGGAGLVGSAADYDRFLHMLLNGGALDGERVLKPETVALALSDLLPSTADTAGTMAAGDGFGALGRVVKKDIPGGPSAGSFGWAGAAGTIGWIDRRRDLRLGGYIQLLPAAAAPFQREVLGTLVQDADVEPAAIAA